MRGVIKLSNSTKYKYKLNYRDFLKLMISTNLYDLEKYIYLQTEPLEIELYFEEILLSADNSFGIGENYTKFVASYYREIEIIVETLLEKGAKEFFKVRTMANKDFIHGLLMSYMDVLKKVDEIQVKLLENRRKEYIPITITVNSYILNRIATSYEEQFTGERILVSDAKDSTGVEDSQVRDLQVKMLCVNTSLNTVEELKGEFKVLNNLRILNDTDQLRGASTKMKESTIDVLKCSEIYNQTLEQGMRGQLDRWASGDTVEILLPYFNHPDRNISSDWQYKRCQLPKGFEGI